MILAQVTCWAGPIDGHVWRLFKSDRAVAIYEHFIRNSDLNTPFEDLAPETPVPIWDPHVVPIGQQVAVKTHGGSCIGVYILKDGVLTWRPRKRPEEPAVSP